MLFRFYDPRVLRLYLPSCTTEELDRVFGSVERFILEDGSGEMLELGCREGRLEERRSAAGNAEEKPFPRIDGG